MGMVLGQEPWGGIPKKRLVKLIRTFEGEIIRNRAFKYKLKIEKQEGSDQLIAYSTTDEFSGWGMISKEMNVMKVIEVDKEKKQSFSEMRKI